MSVRKMVRGGIVVASIAAAAGIGVGAAIAGHYSVQLTSSGSTAAAPTPSPSAKPGTHPSFRGPGGPGGRGGFGGFGGFAPGGMGTVTAESGSTLTLRTATGSLTVTTSSTTTYTKEGASISFGAIHTNDVVSVRGVKPTTPPTTPPAAPPTSIAAASITVEVPSVAGRVQSISGNTIVLVLFNGQLETVTTSSSTKYVVRGSTTAGTAPKAGDFISVQGTPTDLTHTNADVVTSGGGKAPGFGGFGGGGFAPPKAPPAAAGPTTTN